MKIYHKSWIRYHEWRGVCCVEKAERARFLFDREKLRDKSDHHRSRISHHAARAERPESCWRIVFESIIIGILAAWLMLCVIWMIMNIAP